MKKMLKSLLVLVLFGCSFENRTIQDCDAEYKRPSEVIAYSEDNLVIDEKNQNVYYTNEEIQVIKENEETLKKIGIEIVDKKLSIDTNINYANELFKYEAFLFFDQNNDYVGIIVDFEGETISGFYLIEYDDKTYCINYGLFDGSLVPFDSPDGIIVTKIFADGDSKITCRYQKSGNYLYYIE